MFKGQLRSHKPFFLCKKNKNICHVKGINRKTCLHKKVIIAKITLPINTSSSSGTDREMVASPGWVPERNVAFEIWCI